jgi:hypothetical protein
LPARRDDPPSRPASAPWSRKARDSLAAFDFGPHHATQATLAKELRRPVPFEVAAVSGPRYVTPYAYAPGSTGAPIPGALLGFFLSGSDTPTPTYSDVNLTIPNTNPVAANAAGIFPSIFLDPTITYRVIESIPSDGVNPPVEVWTADPVAGAFADSYGGVYVDTLGAEVNSPAFDSYPAFALALNGSNPVVRMQAGAYYLSQAITIPDGVFLVGDAFFPNLSVAAGAQLIFANAVAGSAVQVGTGETNAAAGFSRCQVRRLGSTPPAGTTGIAVAQGYDPYVNELGSFNHAVGFSWTASGQFGITCHSRLLRTGAITDAHFVFDLWPEGFFSQCRLGMDGTQDVNCNAYIRITGAGTGGQGPNTLYFNECQFNQGNPSGQPINCVDWVNTGNTGSNVLEYTFVQCHFETFTGAVFYSDATCASITRLNMIGCTVIGPTTPMFNLNAATSLIEVAFVGGGYYVENFNPPTEQFQATSITGISCVAGPATFNASSGSTIALANNTWDGLTIAGAGNFVINGDTLIGGVFVNNCTGIVLIQSPDFNGQRSWTPTVEIGGASTGITYSVQEGTYEYITSTMVQLAFVINLTAKGALTGNVSIGGLPVTANGTYGSASGGFVANSSGLTSLTGPLYLTGQDAAAALSVAQGTSSGSAELTNASLTNTSAFQGSILLRL